MELECRGMKSYLTLLQETALEFYEFNPDVELKIISTQKVLDRANYVNKLLQESTASTTEEESD